MSTSVATLEDQDVHTPLFSLNGRWFEGKCVKCYDADSVHIVIQWMGTYTRFKCRLYGIDTPELRSKHPLEKQVAKLARDYLRSLILDCIVFIKCHTFDKYGRLLVSIFSSSHPFSLPVIHQNAETHETMTMDGNQKPSGGSTDTYDAPPFERSVNAHVIEKGFAYAYNGGKKKKFAEWYIPSETY